MTIRSSTWRRFGAAVAGCLVLAACHAPVAAVDELRLEVDSELPPMVAAHLAAAALCNALPLADPCRGAGGLPVLRDGDDWVVELRQRPDGRRWFAQDGRLARDLGSPAPRYLALPHAVSGEPCVSVRVAPTARGSRVHGMLALVEGERLRRRIGAFLATGADLQFACEASSQSELHQARLRLAERFAGGGAAAFDRCPELAGLLQLAAASVCERLDEPREALQHLCTARDLRADPRLDARCAALADRLGEFALAAPAWHRHALTSRLPTERAGSARRSTTAARLADGDAAALRVEAEQRLRAGDLTAARSLWLSARFRGGDAEQDLRLLRAIELRDGDPWAALGTALLLRETSRSDADADWLAAHRQLLAAPRPLTARPGR